LEARAVSGVTAALVALQVTAAAASVEAPVLVATGGPAVSFRWTAAITFATPSRPATTETAPATMGALPIV
jgi:hypothetical protein